MPATPASPTDWLATTISMFCRCTSCCLPQRPACLMLYAKKAGNSARLAGNHNRYASKGRSIRHCQGDQAARLGIFHKCCVVVSAVAALICIWAAPNHKADMQHTYRHKANRSCSSTVIAALSAQHELNTSRGGQLAPSLTWQSLTKVQWCAACSEKQRCCQYRSSTTVCQCTLAHGRTL